MSKKANQKGRKKGSDKSKKTLKLYGKYTTRGLRIKQQQLENEDKNKKMKEKPSNKNNKREWRTISCEKIM
jgi:hypothetical protein